MTCRSDLAALLRAWTEADGQTRRKLLPEIERQIAEARFWMVQWEILRQVHPPD